MASAARDWPAENHPLHAADAERSKARVSDIELGLAHPIDGSYWRQKLETRIQALSDDGEMFGLAPHEECEIERLKALRQKAEASDASGA